MTFPKKHFIKTFLTKLKTFPSIPLTNGRFGAIMGEIHFGVYDHDQNLRHAQYDERRDAATAGAFFVVLRRIIKLR